MLMLIGKLEKDDLGIFIIIPTGAIFVAMFTIFNDAPIGISALVFLAAFSMFFGGVFKERLLPSINKYSLLLLNSLLIYLFFKGQLSVAIGLIIFIPTILVFINSFINIDRNFKWRVSFYCWFITMIVLIALLYFKFSDLGFLFTNTSEISLLYGIQALLSGFAFFYIIVNASHLLELIPTQEKNESSSEAQARREKNMEILASRYSVRKDSFLASVGIIMLIGVVLYSNYKYYFIPDTLFIVCVILLSSIPTYWDRKNYLSIREKDK